ncbi:MAG: sigma-70 family RNA polymerase sigma factor [Oscillospiraceae bacterium]|nr:sigma-70 family RNA polymerase sigma factor [Oscillospiraceae bacterium]
MSDNELRALIGTSPAEGHRQVYMQYSQYAFAIIFRILQGCGTREDAEDCLVETFTDVFRHIDQIQGDSIKAYIGMSARNRAYNYCRSLQRHQKQAVPLEEIAEPYTSHVEEDTEHKALQTALLQKIEALGEPDSTIIIQKYYYGRKMSDIAKLVGLTANNAQVRCSRALKRLRKELADWRQR